MEKKYLLDAPSFEQNHYSKTSTSLHKTADDSVRIMKWICYYDRSYYENINYYDLMGSILSCSNEISYW